MLLLLWLVSGCYTLNASLPGTLRGDIEPGPEAQTLDSFEVEVGNTYYFWGLAGSPPLDILEQEIVQEVESRGGNGAANLEFESVREFPDLAINCVTCGIVGPWTYRIKGDAVRINVPPLPGQPPASAALEEGKAPAARSVAMAY